MFVLYHHYGYGKKHLMHTAYKQSPKMAGFGNPRDGWLVLAASLYIYNWEEASQPKICQTFFLKHGTTVDLYKYKLYIYMFWFIAWSTVRSCMRC